jgi:hypothetical protein
MAADKGTAGRHAKRPGRQPRATRNPGGVALDVTPRAAGVAEPWKKHFFDCTYCDHEADATWTGTEWRVGSSFSDRCPKKGDCLRAIAEAVGAPGGGEIKADPLGWLAPYLTGATRRREGRPALLPSEGEIAGWASRLLAEPHALDYLTETRGLSLQTIRRYELGTDGDNITIAVRDVSGAIVNLRRRSLDPDAEPKVWGLYKRGAQLYPGLLPRGAILLVAGEIDALSGRQLRLPAVSTTCGATLPEYLVPDLVGRRVAVMFDAGEEDAMERVVGVLRDAGCKAWAVRLIKLGLAGDADLNDYLVAGGSRERLVRLIRAERKEAMQ